MPKSEEYLKGVADCMAALLDYNKVVSWPGYKYFPYPWPHYVGRAHCDMLAEYIGWQVGSPPFEESSRE